VTESIKNAVQFPPFLLPLSYFMYLFTLPYVQPDMIKEVFEKRTEEARIKAAEFEKKYNLFSYLRVSFTLICLISIVVFANYRESYGIVATVIAFPIGFGLLVRKHNQLKFLRNQFRFISDINKEELLRLDLNMSSFPSGEKYKDEHHNYESDLDIFGHHSLFQLLNRTSTVTGEEKLAQWLLHLPSDKQEIINRQDAIEELAPQIEWRQEFQALGRHFQRPEKDIQIMYNWLEGEDEKSFRMSSLFIWVLAGFNLLSVASYFAFSISGYLIMIPLGISMYFISRVFKEIEHLSKLTESTSSALKTYSKLLDKVENSSFQHSYLQNIQKSLHDEELSARHEVSILGKIVDRIQGRANLMFALVNIAFLYDLTTLNQLDAWKEKNGQRIRLWFESLAELEALQSISGFHFSNPEFALPEIAEENYILSSEALAHPLIPAKSRVANNFSLQGKGMVSLITGSNMSGKSTFLRTVGINCVLAYLGAPVCAKSLTLSQFDIYTSMRTTDKLEESVSSFYAELQRIKGLIEKIDGQEKPVLFMLDEILKGTNSADRHKGAESLIYQLNDSTSMGFVSTHDVELGKLEKEINKVKNFSFNSYLEHDDLIFDYKISEGVCKSFNASILMKKMGIKI